MDSDAAPDPEFESIKRLVLEWCSIDLTFLDRASKAERVEFFKAVLVLSRIMPHLRPGELDVAVEFPGSPEALRILDNAEARRRRKIQ
jgi:hypothetical protein